MTDEEIEAALARAEAATQWADGKDRGEWRAEQIGSGYAVQRLSRGEFRSEDEWVNLGWVDKTNKQPVFGRDGAAFFVAAREDVPRLVAEVRALKAQLATARQEGIRAAVTELRRQADGWRRPLNESEWTEHSADTFDEAANIVEALAAAPAPKPAAVCSTCGGTGKYMGAAPPYWDVLCPDCAARRAE